MTPIKFYFIIIYKKKKKGKDLSSQENAFKQPGNHLAR